ncbi:hypothetical protein ACSSS7_003331 [Eimeria intestinalis]
MPLVCCCCDGGSVKRVVLLAAWHRGDPGLLLPPEEFSGYGTPIGSVPLDTEALSALISTGLYDIAPASLEADEHSVSVQIPFLKRRFWLPSRLDLPSPGGAVMLPIYVGTIPDDELALFAETLVPFFMDPDTVFVVSSDWSHWGPRYHYTYLPPNLSSSLPLSDQIKGLGALDKEAIDCVLALNASCLEDHVRRTQNQICGFDALRLFLLVLERAAESSGKEMGEVVATSLLDYSQRKESQEKQQQQQQQQQGAATAKATARAAAAALILVAAAAATAGASAAANSSSNKNTPTGAAKARSTGGTGGSKGFSVC